MVLATDDHGNQLVELELGDGDFVQPTDAPLTGALVVVTGPEGVLLVHDVWRGAWEIPGGGINDHESSEEAARREVIEESGQQLAGLRRVARATFRLKPDDRLEQADLYKGEVEQVRPFVPNSETDAICWWDGVSPLQDLSAVDAELVRRLLLDDGSTPV